MSLTRSGGLISPLNNGLNSAPSTIEYLVIAGGGSSAGNFAAQFTGGGGGGGCLTGMNYSIVAGATNTITIGAGGAPQSIVGVGGSDTTFGRIICLGGGGGGISYGGPGNGGSGGGAANSNRTGAGTPGQGNNGGLCDTPRDNGGGGGGAGSAGGIGSYSAAGQNRTGGMGGGALVSNITGRPTAYAGGGAGVSNQYKGSASPNGGISAVYQVWSALNGIGPTPTEMFTGGGGSAPGGGFYLQNGPNGAGGADGIVVLRYFAFLNPAVSTTGNPDVFISNIWRVYVFRSSGTITF